MRCAPGYPEAGGLYDPQFEHDSCGVGMVCRIDGTPSHQIISDGLQLLINLSHRGAYGCDAATGDGAGILMQLPHAFLSAAAAEEGIRLPRAGDYACGTVFLPPDPAQGEQLRQQCVNAVEAEKLNFLGWRPVPVNPGVLGPIAHAVEPAIFQFFVGRGADVSDQAHFERKLYVARRVMERQAKRSGLSQHRFFHIPGLSSRTLVYKGMFLAHQLGAYFPDLQAEEMASALALVHQRYSTNTFPTWDLAHPFRFLCHNGEINTLRGNVHWMNARQDQLSSDLFGADMARLFPIATPGASDSAILDNTLELLYHTGRSLPHCIMMLIPEAWQGHAAMPDARKAFYEYHSCLMEPWDGPASIVFTDGLQVGAVLDRNGLRPSRYTITRDGRVIMGSETGVLDLAPENVAFKGRLQPGRMFLVDLQQGRIIRDDEIKDSLAASQPYRRWLQENLVRLDALPAGEVPEGFDAGELLCRQKALGYTLEDFKFVLGPMATGAAEPIGSMGDDTPPAVLSDQPRPLFDYFRQLFAQVTNPPLDAIREELVTSLKTTLGAEAGLCHETPLHCRHLQLETPLLTDGELAAIRSNQASGLKADALPAVYPIDQGTAGLANAMERLCKQAVAAVDGGAAILILSDRAMDRQHAAIPSLLAVAGVHHHLIRQGRRTRCAIVAECGDAREVHHFCCLLGFGAGAVNPYLALASLEQMAAEKQLGDLDAETARTRYLKAASKGILKVMSKMGISTLQSYRGAQIFECIGLDRDLVEKYFTDTPSRIGGAGLDAIARRMAHCHGRGFDRAEISSASRLDAGGRFQWRRDGEFHQYNPLSIARLQQAVRNNDRAAWDEFSTLVDNQNREGALIRGLLKLKPARAPVPLDEVEPWSEIVKYFKTGAMSYGSISKEAHETLAVAMNRLQARSNSGEGGEDADRFTRDVDGEWRNSAIKQVASGRFGVTAHYLASANELQIKMAQGAKPGEGGQLPGFKVYPWIARTRHATPYVTLISPPPHHDIYSIEDLAQLIYDLKNANPQARISVKLVSEVGVGTVAAGVVKAKADVVLISGGEGGTGASPLTSIKYSGLPWELGLSETHQTLVLNGLRHKIVVECDGQIKTGRDLAVACLLGAEEFGFGTIALVCLGCVMMRVCHLNTCPVGIATQDPELRKKFAGRPEHVVNFMRFIAEDLRGIMARLGFRRVADMVGRSECLDFTGAVEHWKARGLDLSGILHRPRPPQAVAAHCSAPADTAIGEVADHRLIELSRPALEAAEPVRIDLAIRNTQRTLGTLLSNAITRRCGGEGLPPDTIVLNCKGSAGQSFCAFGAPGLSVHLEGEANDYFGKGLSGARLSIRPPEGSTFVPEENIIIGNVAFYGATGGRAFINGLAGGDHGCEYMTGGCVVVLGATGRNFAAGMSGGLAYVYDPDQRFAGERCNQDMVDLEVLEPEDKDRLRRMMEEHAHATRSPLARRMLADWTRYLAGFIKVMPRDYKGALAMLEKEKAQV